METEFTFRELQEKYGWNKSGVTQSRMIDFASARGVIIKSTEDSKYKKMMKFIIIDDSIANYEWRRSPKLSEYEVCKEGLVRNIRNKRIWTSTHNGYVYIKDKMTKQDYAAHRIIMEVFNPIADSQDYIVDHINGKKIDNRIENLRWVSAKGNNMYKTENWDLITEPFKKLLDLVGYKKLISILEEQIAIYKK